MKHFRFEWIVSLQKYALGHKVCNNTDIKCTGYNQGTRASVIVFIPIVCLFVEIVDELVDLFQMTDKSGRTQTVSGM
jgi:hypothetical protein